MLFEGEVTLFTVAYLTHHGYFDLPDIAPIVIAGVIAGDLMWYELGKHVFKSPFLDKWLGRASKKLDEQIQKSPGRAIFISKFTYGLHRLTLIRSGFLNVPFFKFFRADLLSSLIWIILIGALGFAASAGIKLFVHLLKYAEIGLAAAVLIFLLAEQWFGRKAREKIE